jgi:poly(A) polymerase Pap1
MNNRKAVLNMAAQAQHKGVTPPISVLLPTAAELSANDALIEELKRRNSFEESEATEKRYAIERRLYSKS